MKKVLLLSIIITFCFLQSSYAQIDSAVNLLSDSRLKLPIKDANEEIYLSGERYRDSIILARYRTSFNFYYHIVDSLAKDQELISLTSHSSPEVQSCAAIILGYRDTTVLPEILSKMLDNPTQVSCLYGDVRLSRITAIMIFTGLWKRKRETGYPSDNYIDNLYSFFLLHKNTPILEVGMQLVCLRNPTLIPALETLAFERRNMSAIRYMNKWYKGEYYESINKACLELLYSSLNTDCENPPIKELIQIMLDLQDEETLQKVGGLLKNNKSWIAIKGINDLLDESFEICDSVGIGSSRYPFHKEDVDFIFGYWKVISGIQLEKYNNQIDKEIILERTKHSKVKKNNIEIVHRKDHLIVWGGKDDDGNTIMVSWPYFDAFNNRICLSSLEWNWYNIEIEGERLILTKE